MFKTWAQFTSPVGYKELTKVDYKELKRNKLQATHCLLIADAAPKMSHHNNPIGPPFLGLYACTFVLSLVVAERSSELDSSSGVSDQQNVDLNLGLDTCVLKQDTCSMGLKAVMHVKEPGLLLKEGVCPGVSGGGY